MLWDAQNVIGGWKQTDRAAVGFVCLSPAHSVEWRAVMGQLKFLFFSSFLFFFFFGQVTKVEFVWVKCGYCAAPVLSIARLHWYRPCPTSGPNPSSPHFWWSLWEAFLKPGHPLSMPHICCRAILLKNSRFKHCSTRTRGSPPQRSPPTFCCGRGSVT